MDAPVFQPEVLSLILLWEFMIYVISTIVVHPKIKRLKVHMILSEINMPSDLYTRKFLPDVIFVLLIPSSSMSSGTMVSEITRFVSYSPWKMSDVAVLIGCAPEFLACPVVSLKCIVSGWFNSWMFDIKVKK
jgi:hypothetical protein